MLFLDIQMPGLNGFEMLGMPRDAEPLVVFTTAYHRYALKAFEVNSIDYLLKPIEKSGSIAPSTSWSGAPASLSPTFAPWRGSLPPESDPTGRLERIASRVGERTTVLEVARISHFTAKIS